MNIAFFTNNYLPNIYGVPISIETFRKEFEKRGHSVFIFAPEFPGYEDKNKNVFRYPSLDIDIKFHLPIGIPFSPRISKIIENLDIDIIHSHHPNILGSAAAKWAKKKNIPLVFTWHTLYDHYTNFVPFLPSKLAAKWIINKAVKYANKSDVVIAPTKSIMPILQDWGVKKKILPVATGVVEKEYTAPERKKIREKCAVRDDQTLLLLVSRLTEEKNINFLFEAVADVLESNKKVKFLLVGDGYQKAYLENETKKRKLENQIIFAGKVKAEKIKDFYAAGDIFVCASKSETQGMTVSEAMYSGLPVVAVKATGIESLVEDNVNGILVSEDKEKFAEAVKKLLRDVDLQKRMAKESARIAREKYTSSVCAEKMLEIYRKAIENKSQQAWF